jgi:hypothetical protein
VRSIAPKEINNFQFSVSSPMARHLSQKTDGFAWFFEGWWLRVYNYDLDCAGQLAVIPHLFVVMAKSAEAWF